MNFKIYIHVQINAFMKITTAIEPRVINFSLPFRLPTLNQRDRMDRFEKTRYRQHLAKQVWIRLPTMKPPEPFRFARVTVTRYSTGVLDPDGLKAQCKALLDVLQCMHPKTHPSGLGVIVGDDPKHLVLRCVLVKSRAEQTDVRIEELEILEGI